MTDLERRAFVVDGLQIETREGGAPRLRGHAAVFHQLSEDLGGFREQILPGAFAEALQKDDVRLLINHDGLPLARTASKTLELSEDARGLAFAADLEPADPDVQRLLPKLKRGDLSQMSFAFAIRPGGQDWAKDDHGQIVRTLKRLRLFGVSVVTYPAYPQTDVGLRELRAWQAQQTPCRQNLLQALAQQARAL